MKILPINYYNRITSIRNKPLSFNGKSDEEALKDFSDFMRANRLSVINCNNYLITPTHKIYNDKIKVELIKNDLLNYGEIKYFTNVEKDNHGNVYPANYFDDRRFGVYGSGRTIKEALVNLMKEHANLYMELDTRRDKKLTCFPNFFED